MRGDTLAGAPRSPPWVNLGGPGGHLSALAGRWAIAGTAGARCQPLLPSLPPWWWWWWVPTGGGGAGRFLLCPQAPPRLAQGRPSGALASVCAPGWSEVLCHLQSTKWEGKNEKKKNIPLALANPGAAGSWRVRGRRRDPERSPQPLAGPGGAGREAPGTHETYMSRRRANTRRSARRALPPCRRSSFYPVIAYH